MRCERFTLAGDAARLVGELRRLIPAPESVSAVVAQIVRAVRRDGEEAVLEHTRRLDTGGAEPLPLRVPDEELEAAGERLDGEVRRALEVAIANLQTAGRALRGPVETEVELGGHTVRWRKVAVHRAAVYVPSGRAPYPSTVLMGVVPARVAGVEEVVVCAPPTAGGDVHPVIKAACRLAGASALYRMGGAQAIAALALGTASVEPVDVIVGPGSLYVQEAKRQLSGRVGIDGFAGPSDLLVVADGGGEEELVALDLLAQAEHGPGTLVIALSESDALLDAVAERLAAAADTGAVAASVRVEDLEAGLALAEAFAPEHLELIGDRAEALAPRVTRAGCVFVGAGSATAFGDYLAGSNHILPTAGAARFASGLTPDHFLRTQAEVRVREAAELARAAGPLARAEGFELHARSMEARIRDNPAR
jgi:histidinol dehydrogenase